MKYPDGLSALDVQERLDRFGKNVLAKEKTGVIKTFFKQFLSPITFILIFAAGLSVLMKDYAGASVIITIIALNSFLSFFQEFRSGKAVEKLSAFIQRKILAIRDGQQQLVDIENLVPGDVIILRSGDIVPADVKIIEANNLEVNESQLTGESLPVKKGIKNNSKSFFLFTGSVIERGQSTCTIIATGNKTELGKIALLSKNTKRVTPFQKSLKEFSLSILKLIGATLLLMIAVKAIDIHSYGSFVELTLFSISLAMTVLPEALTMVTTINLSSGALQLAKQKTIVKRLSAIEDLGRINILCTDKTGTLTEDCLTVSEIISKDEVLFQKFAAASLNNPGIHENNENSFDNAFSNYIPPSIKDEIKNFVQLCALPFDPSQRRRRVILQDPSCSKTYLVVIGAAETLLALSKADDTDYPAQISQCGKQGLRQLAIAYKEIEYNPEFDIPANESELIFLGFANLSDPLRKTAKSTIEQAKELGIEIKILSGDSPEVVKYIGKQISLVKHGQKIYSGEELEHMTDAELYKTAKQCSVFARVTPEQKYRIIQQLKKDNIVGYQGDGINDAPSLKLADVAIAVHNATDVAKDSADIILLEDNLNVIISGIQYGRSIFVNINKYIKHAMIGNLGNFFSLIFFYLVFAVDNIPMLPIQLLIANLIQDMPLMTVYSDSVEHEEVKKPHIANQVKSVVRTSLLLGIFTAVFYLGYMLFVGITATALTQANLFLFFNFTQLLIIVSVRKKQFFLKGKKPSNLLLSAILLFISLSVVLVYVPFTSKLLGFAPLPVINLLIISAVSIVYLFLLDLFKVGINKIKEKRADAAAATNNI